MSDLLGDRNLLCMDALNSLDMGRRTKAIETLYYAMDKYGDFGMREKLDVASDDYKRMQEYWSKGVNDPNFEKVSERNKKNLADIVSEYTTRAMNTEDACYLLTLDRQAKKKNESWEWESVKQRLESLMSDEAVAGLDFNGNGKERIYRIVDEHYEYQKRLFNHTVTLGLLSRDDAELIKQLLSSPTIDVGDQQMIVTALSLSGGRAFDIRKFDIMAYTCTNGADMKVRQRALVGLVLTAGKNMDKIYPAQKEILDRLLADEDIASQLIELQMQLVYCMRAIDDSRMLDNEILPNMVKASNFSFSEDGFKELEEDPMDDILGKNIAEKRTEEAERLLNKMKDMQEAGADMFFTGFAKMKRGPFFEEMANWFIPYSPMHKVVREVVEKAGNNKWVETLIDSCMVCDSDRYSFVVLLGDFLNRLSPSAMESLNSLSEMGTRTPQEDSSPTLYRRNYLQNLYRFFKLFRWRNGLLSPFERYCDQEGCNLSYVSYYLFMFSSLFVKTKWYEKEQPGMLLFMSKNKSKQILNDLEAMAIKGVDSYEGCMSLAKLKMDMSFFCVNELEKALRYKPDSVIAKKLLAREILDDRPKEASKLLEQVVAVEKDKPQYRYLLALAYFNNNDYEKALPILYELEYKYPDNVRVRTLLGTLLFLLNDIDRAYSVMRKGVDFSTVNSQIVANVYLLLYWIKTHSREEILRLSKEYDISLYGLYDFKYGIPKVNEILNTAFLNGIGKEELCMLTDMLEERGK